MRKIPLVLLLLAVCAAGLWAQTGDRGEVEDTRPLWLRDIRRWEIVTFGSFPFTMFFTTIGMDIYRWEKDSGMDWGQRQFAPWPLKSAGAVAMTDEEQRNTILMAAGLSVTIAIVDHFLERGRRQKERRRAEVIPSGTIVITRTPPVEEPPEVVPDDDMEDEGNLSDLGDDGELPVSLP